MLLVLLRVQGMGDVLLTYENEAIFTNLVVAEKDRLPFIVPDQNIRVRAGRLCLWVLKWTERY